jgi:hypothetical protein
LLMGARGTPADVDVDVDAVLGFPGWIWLALAVEPHWVGTAHTPMFAGDDWG